MAMNQTERPVDRPRRSARDRALLLPPTACERRSPLPPRRLKGRVVWRKNSMATTWGPSEDVDALQRAPRPPMRSHTLIGPPTPRPFRRRLTDGAGTLCLGPGAFLAAR